MVQRIVVGRTYVFVIRRKTVARVRGRIGEKTWAFGHGVNFQRQLVGEFKYVYILYTFHFRSSRDEHVTNTLATAKHRSSRSKRSGWCPFSVLLWVCLPNLYIRVILTLSWRLTKARFED